MGLQSNTHSMECVYGQINIQRNVSVNKKIFYEMRPRVKIHSTKCAYGQIYVFYGMCQLANKYYTE